MSCSQKDCDQPGSYTFLWPGRDLMEICEGHVEKLRQVADAIGIDVHIERIHTLYVAEIVEISLVEDPPNPRCRFDWDEE